MRTTNAPTNAVFASQRVNRVSRKSSCMFSMVGGRLNRNGLLWMLYRSRMRLNTVIAIQANGKAAKNVNPAIDRYNHERPIALENAGDNSRRRQRRHRAPRGESN